MKERAGPVRHDLLSHMEAAEKGLRPTVVLCSLRLATRGTPAERDWDSIVQQVTAHEVHCTLSYSSLGKLAFTGGHVLSAGLE